MYNEINWQPMFIKGGEVSRKIAIQGTFIENENSVIYPIYRQPAESQPKTTLWVPTSEILRKICSDITGQELNHALIQLYPDGKSWISEHSDKTLDIKHGTNIISLSLGATRTMVLMIPPIHISLSDLSNRAGFSLFYVDHYPCSIYLLLYGSSF
jgi:hypothetical protein